MSTINFKDLKKELKDIPRLSDDNLDVSTWRSELKLWIEIERVTDPKKIFWACVLTTAGEPRRIIQSLENSAMEDSEVEEDSDDESESSDSNSEEVSQYPSLDKVATTIEEFYGINEDQDELVRKLRALRIGRNEKVKEFNVKYKTLYLKLNKKKKRQISVLDYITSIENNYEAWKRVTMKDDITLTQAYKIAEKVDRLRSRVNNNLKTDNFSKPSHPSRIATSNQANIKTFNKNKEDAEITDLTKRMKNLTIKACYFCKEKGHYQNQCPKLRAIVEKNREEINNARLNF